MHMYTYTCLATRICVLRTICILSLSHQDFKNQCMSRYNKKEIMSKPQLPRKLYTNTHIHAHTQVVSTTQVVYTTATIHIYSCMWQAFTYKKLICQMLSLNYMAMVVRFSHICMHTVCAYVWVQSAYIRRSLNYSHEYIYVYIYIYIYIYIYYTYIHIHVTYNAHSYVPLHVLRAIHNIINKRPQYTCHGSNLLQFKLQRKIGKIARECLPWIEIITYTKQWMCQRPSIQHTKKL
jgi:hypothetical protein